MPNIELRPYQRPSMWRKMSMANWRHPTDPQVYGRMELDMKNAIAYAEKLSAQSQVKVTPTHIIVRAMALALKTFPSANAVIRWYRVYQRKQVDVFCQVAIPGENPDLSGVVVRNADTKSPIAISSELRDRADHVRKGTDKELERTRKSMNILPAFLFRFVLAVIGFLQFTLNLALGFLGLPKDAFGGAMVTSIGSLGISEAFAPLVPMSRVPIVVAVGKVEDKPVVRDGQIVIRPVCVLGATFDHRIMDGILAGKLATFLQDYIGDPEKHEKDMPAPIA